MMKIQKPKKLNKTLQNVFGVEEEETREVILPKRQKAGDLPRFKEPGSVPAFVARGAGLGPPQPGISNSSTSTAVGGSGSVAGVVPPPRDPEVRRAIEQLSTFAAKQGPEFEDMVREKNQGNLLFKFLFDVDSMDYHYYQQCLAHHREEAKPRPPSPPPASTETLPTVYSTWDRPPSSTAPQPVLAQAPPQPQITSRSKWDLPPSAASLPPPPPPPATVTSLGSKWDMPVLPPSSSSSQSRWDNPAQTSAQTAPLSDPQLSQAKWDQPPSVDNTNNSNGTAPVEGGDSSGASSAGERRRRRQSKWDMGSDSTVAGGESGAGGAGGSRWGPPVTEGIGAVGAAGGVTAGMASASNPPPRRGRFSEGSGGGNEDDEGSLEDGLPSDSADSIAKMTRFMQTLQGKHGDNGQQEEAPVDDGRKHHIGHYLPDTEYQKYFGKKDPNAVTHDPTVLTSQNKGHQLLSKMGWSEGTGLGRKRTGIAVPIQAASHAAGVGLGATNDHVEVGPGDDPFTTYKKRMALSYRHRPNPLGNPRQQYWADPSMNKGATTQL